AGNCLEAGQYLFVMDPAVLPAPGALTVLFPGATNQVQNGAPDGLALIDVATSTVIDALSYEGAITAAHLDGFAGPVTLVEGTPTAVADSNADEGSMDREPN